MKPLMVCVDEDACAERVAERRQIPHTPDEQAHALLWNKE
jgi:hypothetical protein